MKKNLILSVLALAALALVSCTAGNQAPAATASADPATVLEAPTGAYAAADLADAGVKEAADFAVAQLAAKDEYKDATLTSIDQAESQIVAGTNFRMTLTLKVADAAKQVIVVVYRDLQPVFSLTSVEAVAAK